jgi:hypothetical protein
MKIADMHIGIEVALREVNTLLYNKYQYQEKDYFINRVITEYINDILQFNTATPLTNEGVADIYQKLDPLYYSRTLDKITGTNLYDYAVIPKNTGKEIGDTGDYIWHNIEYQVTTAGNTNLINHGGTNPPLKNNKFTAQLMVIDESNQQDYVAILTTEEDIAYDAETPDAVAILFIKGNSYEILTNSFTTPATKEMDFVTEVGASSNAPGTKFTANWTTINKAKLVAVATGQAASLQILSCKPEWIGGTRLFPTFNYDMFKYVVSKSNVDLGSEFGTGNLIAGVRYKITIGGTIANLTTLGSAFNQVVAGYVFTCTANGTPTWASSGVRMIATQEVSNKLILPQEVDNFLNHGYGTVQSNPLATIIGGQLRVYHGSKFTINEIKLEYVRPPVEVNYLALIDCDLNSSIHPTIVDKTVKYITALNGLQSYTAIQNELKDNK